MAKVKPMLPRMQALRAENKELRMSNDHLINQTVKQLADIEELKDENRVYENENKVLKAKCVQLEEVISTYKETLTEQYSANKSMNEKIETLTTLVAEERKKNQKLMKLLKECNEAWWKRLLKVVKR